MYVSREADLNEINERLILLFRDIVDNVTMTD